MSKEQETPAYRETADGAAPRDRQTVAEDAARTGPMLFHFDTDATGKTKVFVLSAFYNLLLTADFVNDDGKYVELEPVDLEDNFGFPFTAGVEDPPCF